MTLKNFLWLNVKGNYIFFTRKIKTEIIMP